MEVTRAALVNLPIEAVFDLIEHAEHYPEFLPWCTDAEIQARSAEQVRARVGFGYGGLRAHMDTTVHKDYPHRMRVEVHGRPFERFQGEWQLSPLGAGCRIEFRVQCAINDPVWDALLQLAAQLIADRLVAAFLKRARATIAPLPPSVPAG